jgi:hypothetical protein
VTVAAWRPPVEWPIRLRSKDQGRGVGSELNVRAIAVNAAILIDSDTSLVPRARDAEKHQPDPQMPRSHWGKLGPGADETELDFPVKVL